MTTKKTPRASNAQDEAKIVDDLRAFSVTAAHEIMLGFDRLKALRDALEADDTGSEIDAQERREKSKKLSYELAKTQIKHAESLVSLSHQHADLLFENARKLIRDVRRRAPGADNKPLRVIDFEIELHAGKAKTDGTEVTTAELAVTNPFSVKADVLIKTEKFTTSDGSAAEPAIEVKLVSVKPVPANSRGNLKLQIKAPAKLAEGVYFSELDVSLMGDVTERVARRALRVRVTTQGAQ